MEHTHWKGRNFTLSYERILWSVYENICMSGWAGDRMREKKEGEKSLKRGKKEQPKNAAFKNVNSEFIPCGSSGSFSLVQFKWLGQNAQLSKRMLFFCSLANQRHSQEGSKSFTIFVTIINLRVRGWKSERIFLLVLLLRFKGRRISHIDTHWMLDDAIMRDEEGKAFCISDHYSITC
jgi:hypothetical protein